jgi:two-component system NtrC family response regulator
MKRAVIMAEGSRLAAEDLGLEAPEENLESLNLRQVRDEAERRAVLRVLARTNGNIARAADILGVSRPTLYDLMNRFGLKKEA